MTTRRLGRALLGAALVSLALPVAANANLQDAVAKARVPDSVPINTIWVVVAAVLVMFMQAGFASWRSASRAARTRARWSPRSSPTSRSPRSATGRSASPSPSATATIIGHDRLLPARLRRPAEGVPDHGPSSDATIESKFGSSSSSFCAVSLAIVWGTTLERIKFGVYVIYAIVFSALIYPIGSHWVFGGGWLQANVGMQDFAGSTVVHLIGATGALAALLLLGARRGKYGADGKPRAIPGHNMPLFGLGVLILWLGWFGFNPGSTLNALDGRFAGDRAGDEPRGRRRRDRPPSAMMYCKTKTIDIGMAGNGAIAALVAITAPSGYVELWAAPIIGVVAGVIVVVGVLAIDKKLDDPVGALSAHGLAGIWGTLSCGIFTAPRAGRVQRGRRGAACSTPARSTSSAARRRRPGRVRLRVRRLLRGLLGDQEDVRAARHAPRKRTPDWTSPSTACTATRSSSSRLPSSSGTRRARRRRA